MSEVGDRARQAFSASRWREAYAGVATVGPDWLCLEELELLAVSTYLVGAESASLQAWQLAHAEAPASARPPGPPGARSGWRSRCSTRDLPRGGGWVDRGRRRLEGADCVEQGYLVYAAGLRAVLQLHRLQRES